MAAAAALAVLAACPARAQVAGDATNHAFLIGTGAGNQGYTSLLCGSAQFAVGQSAADPICRTISGDVTINSSGVTVLGNIPSATPMAGSLLATAIAAPSTPASGKGSIYVDSTSKNIAVKNDAGTINHGVQTKAAVSSQWIRSIADDGSSAQSQPAFSDISGSFTCAQKPAESGGDVTSSAGSCTLSIGATKVVSAMLNSDVFSTAHSWGGVQTLAAPIFTGTADNQGTLKLSSFVTSTQITSNQNNYTATDGSNTCTTKLELRISTDASRNVTGLSCSQAEGDIRYIHNVGSNPVVLTNQDTNSTGANRFLFGGDLTIAADNGIALRYDGVSTRWRPIVSPGASGGGSFTAATKAQQQAGSDNTVGVTPLHQQDHKSATKAWGTITAVCSSGTCTLGDSYNVTSVTRSSQGIYVVNFTTNFSSAAYACGGTLGNGANIQVPLAGKNVAHVEFDTFGSGGSVVDSSFDFHCEGNQ